MNHFALKSIDKKLLLGLNDDGCSANGASEAKDLSNLVHLKNEILSLWELRESEHILQLYRVVETDD